MMGLRVKPSALKDIIEEIDMDRSGYLEFDEFCTLSARFLIEEDEEGVKKELKEAFRYFDKDGNGYIPTTALKEILHELDAKLTDRELDGIIEEIDGDGSGTVDFDGKLEIVLIPFEIDLISSLFHFRIHGNDDWLGKQIKRSNYMCILELSFLMCPT